VTIHRVLCPVDFSEPSLRALHHAAAVAAWYDAELHVLHVAAAPMPLAVPMMVMAARAAAAADAAEMLAPARRELEAFLTRAALPRTAIPAVREGPAVTAIVRYAGEITADLVVVGSHGREGIAHVLFGSTAERVLHKAPCPVLVVPAHAGEPTVADRIAIRHVLCAVDFSPSSARALALALSVAHENAARLTVLHVIEALSEDDLEAHPTLAVREHVDGLARLARARLLAAVPREARARCAVTDVVRLGRAAHGILAEAEARDADLIVMGAQGHSGLGLLILGSATQAVVRRATCPVLTTRP
jgi:nucleotide-binding universal stress UspA family protein